MKSVIFWGFLVILLIFSISAISQTGNNTHKSRVKRVMGVGVFIQSRPVRTYDTVCVFKTNKKLESYPGASTPNVVKGIEPAIDDLVNKAIASNRRHDRKTKRGKKLSKKRIDAIITDDVKTAVAICWNTESKINDYDHALPLINNPYALLLRCEPLLPYSKHFKVKIRSKLNLEFTGYGSLTKMLNTLLAEVTKTADSLKIYPHAFITENGIDGWAITFNK